MSKEEKKRMEEYEVQSAMDTLQRAEEIKSNSSMMAKVKKAAAKKQKELQKIAGPTKKTSKKKTSTRAKRR